MGALWNSVGGALRVAGVEDFGLLLRLREDTKASRTHGLPVYSLHAKGSAQRSRCIMQFVWLEKGGE
jgi:hypothetical protein